MSRFQADARAAAATLLRDYGASAGIRLQVYPARPRSIQAPTAFVDGIRESFDWRGPMNVGRTVFVDVIVVHGVFDSADAAAQKDAFMDGFLDWVKSNPHAIAANTLTGLDASDDMPAWSPDWMPPDQTKTYYATSLTLRGEAFE